MDMGVLTEVNLEGVDIGYLLGRLPVRLQTLINLSLDAVTR